MPTLHARIVDAMRKEGREVREVGARGQRRWDDLVITGNTIEHFSVQPWPRCTYCTETAAHMSPNTRGGVSVPVCDACRESMCAMGQYAQAVRGLEEDWEPPLVASGHFHAVASRAEPFDPVVRLVDSDYVLPDDPTWAGTRRRP